MAGWGLKTDPTRPDQTLFSRTQCKQKILIWKPAVFANASLQRKLHLPLLSYRQNNKMLQNETKHHKMTNISEMAGKHEANKPRCYRIQFWWSFSTEPLWLKLAKYCCWKLCEYLKKAWKRSYFLLAVHIIVQRIYTPYGTGQKEGRCFPVQLWQWQWNSHKYWERFLPRTCVCTIAVVAIVVNISFMWWWSHRSEMKLQHNIATTWRT